MNHTELIKSIAKGLADIGESSSMIVELIDDTILNSAASMLKKISLESTYEKYLDIMATKDYPLNKSYHDMTEDEQLYVDLIRAEAYFTLYYLCVKLRKLRKGDFQKQIDIGIDGRKIEQDDLKSMFSLQERFMLLGIEAIVDKGDVEMETI